MKPQPEAESSFVESGSSVTAGGAHGESSSSVTAGGICPSPPPPPPPPRVTAHVQNSVSGSYMDAVFELVESESWTSLPHSFTKEGLLQLPG